MPTYKLDEDFTRQCMFYRINNTCTCEMFVFHQSIISKYVVYFPSVIYWATHKKKCSLGFLRITITCEMHTVYRKFEWYIRERIFKLTTSCTGDFYRVSTLLLNPSSGKKQPIIVKRSTVLFGLEGRPYMQLF